MRAVRSEAPDDVIAIAVLRHGDVQPVDALPLHLCRQARPLGRSRAAAPGPAVEGDRHLLQYLPVRPHEDGAELGLPAPNVEVALLHLHDQVAR